MSYQTPMQKRLRRKFRMTLLDLVELQAVDPQRANSIAWIVGNPQRPVENPQHQRHNRRAMGVSRRQYRKHLHLLNLTH